ncbi:MAG TPA: MBL fold metallo-hydrolase [Phototrophicaceae bacterium]|nr:MBL fold metallo-hydrolase [Phototrophicaceae bacterium]
MDKWTYISPVGNGSAHTRFQEKPYYSEGLYDLNHGLYAWMVPNGSWGESNAGLIVGDGESLLVDTLWDLTYTRAMLDGMQTLTNQAPLRTVINTHADGDHWFGNQLVGSATIITSAASLQEMYHTKPQSLILLGKLGQWCNRLGFIPGAGQVGHWFQNMVAPYDFASVVPQFPTQTFSGTLTLTIGGREVQLIEVGPAHTQGDLMVYVPDAKTLFSADIVFIGSTPVMWAGPVENWIAALDRILALDVDTIVPGHGPITDKAGVQQVKDYWTFVQAAVRQQYEAGRSPEQAAQEIALSAAFQEQFFAAWNSPERIMTSTHTIYRQLNGQTTPPSVPQLINILRKQALLAHRLPEAQPAVMRKPTH